MEEAGAPWFSLWCPSSGRNEHVGRGLLPWEAHTTGTGPPWTAGASLVVQGLRLHTPNAGGLGSTPGQGTRSRVPQLKTLLQLKIPRAITKTQCRQINNKYIFLKDHSVLLKHRLCSVLLTNVRKLKHKSKRPDLLFFRRKQKSKSACECFQHFLFYFFYSFHLYWDVTVVSSIS